MKTVNKVASLVTHLANNKNTTHYGMMLLRHGFKGAATKVNPAMLMIDVGLSVLEACNSYLKYAKECEITKQIQHENKLLKVQLEEQLKSLHLGLEVMNQESRVRCQELERAVSRVKVSTQQMQDSIQQMLGHAKKMQAIVKSERERGISFEQLQQLQKQLDNFIRSLIMYALNCTEEN